MQKSTWRLFMLLLFVLIFSSCSKDVIEEEVKVYDQVAKNSVSYDYTEIELEIMERINDYRAGKELQPLKQLAEISLEAEEHTNYMITAGEVSHDNFSKRYSVLVGTADAKLVSENVAFGYRTADAVVAAWINSDAHRKNMEDEHTHFGISVNKDVEGKNYFTNIFIKK